VQSIEELYAERLEEYRRILASHYVQRDDEPQSILT
jgi:hypothetical protein